MASFSVDEFVGNGALFEVLDELVTRGWDDVPTLKLLSAADLDDLQLTQRQREALEIRIYLHNRALMEYADRLEATRKSLQDLLSTALPVLVHEYGMVRSHAARFLDRVVSGGLIMPPDLQRKRAASKPVYDGEGTGGGILSESMSAKHYVPAYAHSGSHLEEAQLDGVPEEPGQFKGIVAAIPAPARMCGLVQPPTVVEDVTPLEILERANIKKLLPEYRVGVSSSITGAIKLPPPIKASEIWQHRTTVVYCLRRPGCVMCRAEAHELYCRKPIFDALGVQLVAVLNEFIDPEVKAFWPRYWGGQIYVDSERDLFRALGGGKLLKDSFISGFIFNPLARQNFKRAKALPGIEYNTTGEGTIKGGLFIVRPGKTGVAYQFVERTFGDRAPLEEVISVCRSLRTAHQ